MTFEDFKIKDSVLVVFTGEGKGKTSAAIGLLCRALGNRWKVAFIQYIKDWGVSEHVFLRDIQPLYKDQLYFVKSGKGFVDAPQDLSPKQITFKQHRQLAQKAYQESLVCVSNGKYNLVICDEINNAVHQKLITIKQLEKLITSRSAQTSLCLTGRDFPKSLINHADIITDMHKLKHHFDQKFLANKGIDY